MRELSKLRTHVLDCLCLEKLSLAFFVRRLLLTLSRRTFLPRRVRRKMVSIAKSTKETEYESVITPYMKIEDGKCFVDVGAHIGIHTKRIALKGITVYAFEPNSAVHETLRKNVEHLSNVKVFDCALGERNGEATFYIRKDIPACGFGSLHNIYGRKDVQEVYVKVRTLDSFNFPNVGLIKVDTEGNEFNILKGSLKTLRKQKPRLVLEIHEPLYENARLITHLLLALGYESIKHVCKANRDQFFIVTGR